jgi:putative heme transporter
VRALLDGRLRVSPRPGRAHGSPLMAPLVSGRLPWPLVFQVLGVIAVLWVVVRTWQIWLLAFTAVIVAAAILPAARLGERHRVPRGVTVLAVYLLVVAVFALMGRLLWPALSQQGSQFMEQLPRLIDNVRGWLGSLDVWIAQWGASLPAPKADDVQGLVGTLWKNTLTVTTGVVGAVFGFIAVVVIAAYIVIDAEHLGAGALALVPPAHRPTVADLTPPVLGVIGGYIRGQILSSLCVGAVLAIGLALLGVRYPLLIGALAAVLNVVPFVGSLIAAILGVTTALNESFGLGLATAGLFAGTNLLEGKFLAPHFVGRATGLHPLPVLVALLAGAHLAGLIGALVAVPLLGAVWEIVRRVYVQRADMVTLP